MKKVLVVIICALFVFSCQKKKSGEAAPLVVAMELQFPPFETSDAEGNPKGISVDIANALGAYLERPVEIRNTAWDGLIPALKSKSVDVIISSMSITEERKKSIAFSDPYAGWYMSFVTHSDSGIESFSDLGMRDGAVVAIKTGTTGEQVVARMPQVEIRRFDSADTAILEVAQRKVDAFLYDPLTIFGAYEKNPEELIAILEPIPGSNAPLGMGVRKDNGLLLNQINEFIKEAKQTGLFEKFAKNYLEDFFLYLASKGYPSFFESL